MNPDVSDGHLMDMPRTRVNVCFEAKSGRPADAV